MRPAFLRTTAAAKAFGTRPALTGAMDRTLPAGEVRRLPDLGIALKSIVAFWLLYIGADHAARGRRSNIPISGR